ncbi:MAG: NAD-dependent epimerase/dehydratase family protein [Steroidobacteraceae bacterium]
MTIIGVSGASGFLGRHLCPALRALGNDVIEMSRADLGSENLCRKLEGADVVIHLAARAHVLQDTSGESRAEFWKSNVGLTQSIARAAKSAGVRRFVFLSSAGVLGANSPPGGFDDDSLPCPHDAYTASKLEAEMWLSAELGARMQLAILRPPLIYGPGAKGNFRRLLRLALKGWPLPIGGFRAQRSMIGIRNIVDLIRVVATDPRVTRATLLAADRETISVSELFRVVSRLAGHRPWLAPVPPALINWALGLSGRRSDIVRLTDPFVLRPAAAQSQFGWTPPHLLRDELRRTVFWELETTARQKN